MNKHQINDLVKPQHHKHTHLHQPTHNSKQYSSLCLNQSQLKHQYAIRPYPSVDRKTSRKEHRTTQSPHPASRSKSKRLDQKTKKFEEVICRKGDKKSNEIQGELLKLKSQYKTLNGRYVMLALQKSKQLQCWQVEKKALVVGMQNLEMQVLRYKKENSLLSEQIMLVKRQCYRVLEMQRFKLKKIQQILQQKQLMIAFLRNQLSTNQPYTTPQHSLFLLPSHHTLNYNQLTSHNPVPTHPHNSMTIVEEDSLSLSRDKSKEMDSIFYSFLSNNGQHSRLSQAAFIKKTTNNNMLMSLSQSPIDHQDGGLYVSEVKRQSDYDAAEVRIKQYSDPLLKNRVKFSESGERDKDTIELSVKARTRPKQLQIITNENIDLSNVPTLRQDCSQFSQNREANSLVMLSAKQKARPARKKKT